ncbi:MAG TPA: toll/interleukin-1 receptor domain-containing protein, partial [Pyrinomonadaceae bacterium]
MDEYDVFISYAHRDNQPLLEEASDRGWVSNFDEILSKFLTRELGRDARIWRDRNNRPGDFFGDKIKENLLKSKSFVLVLSPSYVNSDWCRKELDTYLAERKPIRIEDKSCIFPVITKPVEQTQIPPKWQGFLKDVLAAEFFKREGDGKTLTLDVEYGDEELKRELLKRIDFLAQDINLLLKKGVRESTEPSALKPFLGMTIYMSMAEPTPDLWDDYQKIRRDFIKRGATVLPSSFDFS